MIPWCQRLHKPFSALCGYRRELHGPSDHSVGLHHLRRRHLLRVCLHRWAQPGLCQRSSGNSPLLTLRANSLIIYWCYRAIVFHWWSLLCSPECDSVCWCQWKTVPSDQRPGCWQVPGMEVASSSYALCEALALIVIWKIRTLKRAWA